MAFVHAQSCECAKSELDIFSVPPTQTSVEIGGVVEYHPISSISDSAPIEFNIGGSGQDYLDLANTQLYVRAQIVRANGTPIDNTHNVAPTNLWMHSLFSEVDVKLNDTLVTSTNNTYSYRAYLETLLSYGPAAKKSQLTSVMFYKDSAGAMECTDPNTDPVPNDGLKKRHRHVAASAVVDMMGCIHCDLFFQDKYIPNDVSIRIRLVRQKDAFALMSDDPAAYKIKIIDCKLFVRKAKLSASVFVAHAKALELGNAKYPVRRVICKTFTVPRGNLDYSQEQLFSGQLPTRLVVGCVDNDAFNGAYDKNPYNFKNYNLTQLKVYMDGQPQFVKPLEPNFASNQYVASFLSLFSGTGKLNKDEGNDISRSEYPNGFALYAFDLTPDLAEHDHFNLHREGSLRLDLRFGTALPATINVIAYAEFENVLEIDRNRNILFDYNT